MANATLEHDANKAYVMNLAPFYPLAGPWLRTHRVFRRFSPDRGGFRILTFHDVPESQYAAFDRIIGYLLDRHHVLSPSEAAALLDGAGAADNAFLITFDDGYSSNRHVARKLLNRVGIKAMFFVCPALLDVRREEQPAAISRHMFDGGKCPSNLALMSWADVEALAAEGHCIGSHTLRHRRLSTAEAGERNDEIVVSAEVLENRLGTTCRWFAYPFGDIRSIDAASCSTIAQRYTYCCSGIRGSNSTRTHRLALRRDSVDLNAPWDYQMLSLYGGLDFLYLKAGARLDRFVRNL